MATLVISRDTVTLHMTTLEHAEGFHGDIAVPTSSVQSARITKDVWSELKGIRAPGTGLPGVIAVGTRRTRSGNDFAAVHGRGPGVVLTLAGQDFVHLILTVPDPDAVIAELRAVGVASTGLE